LLYNRCSSNNVTCEICNGIFDEPVLTEERVVYIMVEVRKLMEHANLRDADFSTLRFFSNWVAHTKLTRGQAVKLVKRMNDSFDNRLRGQRMTEEQHLALPSLFRFETFRDELREFLRSQDLVWARLELWPEWVSFMKNYAGVVAECPIIYAKKDLRWMDRAVISTFVVDDEVVEYAREDYPGGVRCPFGIRWAFFKGEQQVMRWELPIMYGEDEQTP
jgi:hypothetical protein